MRWGRCPFRAGAKGLVSDLTPGCTHVASRILHLLGALMISISFILRSAMEDGM